MRCLICLALCCLCSGCESLLKSRYAMNDPVYAEKYAEGADRDDLVGKAKQAVDARFVDNLAGWYLSGGLQKRSSGPSDPFTGAEIGYEYYPTSWFSHRLGGAAYWGGDEGYLGADGGIRLQLPARATPFVGLGAIAGVSRSVSPANDDREDNDDDHFIDEGDEEESSFDGAFVGVYPEVGAHLWLNGNIRLSASGKYWITSLGRDNDDWLVGGQVTFFTR